LVFSEFYAIMIR